MKSTKTGDAIVCSERVCTSCSTSNTRPIITLVKNPMTSHE